MYYRDTIVAGRTIIRSLRASARIKSAEQKRKAKGNPTSEAVKKINLKNAVRILTAKLNHNFGKGDYHIVLTYKELVTVSDAKKNLDNFLRNLRGYCKKKDIEFKWVAVTEYKHKRVHHHLVVKGPSIEVIDKFWKHGYEYPVMLDETGNYYKLAEYLLKETERTFREEGSPQKKRYSTSRNVVMPDVKREKVSGREATKELKALKGYSIDQDTVKRYEHAILEVDCVEYIMVSLDDEPRIKRWPKGRSVKLREPYKDYERQMTFEDLYV